MKENEQLCLAHDFFIFHLSFKKYKLGANCMVSQSGIVHGGQVLFLKWVSNKSVSYNQNVLALWPCTKETKLVKP